MTEGQIVNFNMFYSYLFRWLRLRLNMIPLVAGFLEPLGESIPLGLYAAWSAYYFYSVNPYIYFSCHWLLWFTLDYINLKGVQVCYNITLLNMYYWLLIFTPYIVTEEPVYSHIKFRMHLKVSTGNEFAA